MFKSTRWRSEKNKIKAVFKLQFHATQLAPNVGDALTIAVIPSDTGKPTARLEKTKVKDGSCYWEKPHSETVKFTRDQKTGKIIEKIYRFVVATGSSVYGIVGEVSLDLSSYAEATKCSSVSLPLKNAKFTSLLHVSVQRVQDQNANTVVETYKEVVITANVIEDDKNLKAQISDVTSIGSDLTLSSSDSSSESKNPKSATSTTINEEEHRKSSSRWDWLDDSVRDLSTDDSSKISPIEPLVKDDGYPDDVIKKLEGEIVILSRQADVSEMELQSLRKQVAALKEKVKVNDNSLTERGDPWALVDEMKQELNHEKELNSNLRLQLRKTQESNAELILAVRDLDELLESKSKSKSKRSKLEIDDDEEQNIIDLYNEIELYKRDKNELAMQIEQFALDYEILKQEKLKSYANVNELECQIENLKNELRLKSEALAESVIVIEELETHITNLESDLDNQGRGFEADMEDLIRLKVEQEQRAIHAEETLRKVKLQHASTAGKLQDEFRKLSSEMALAFQESENAAMKAIEERRDLEEVVKKVKEGVDFLVDQYEVKLVEVFNEITLKSKRLEEMEKRVKSLSHGAIRGVEVNVMKEKVKLLEGQIKLKEAALECSEALFLEKENDLKRKIEELERQLEVLDSNASTISDDETKKTGDEKILEVSAIEMELLNKNKSMEIELKELQERYSEISLKFAEVEGERQQLVMTLRNLKNTKK